MQFPADLLNAFDLKRTLGRNQFDLRRPHARSPWPAGACREPASIESPAKGVAFAGRGIRSLILFSLALVFFMLPSLALTQQTSSKTQPSDKASLVGNGNGSTEPDSANPIDPNYVIGPQDMLDISVW